MTEMDISFLTPFVLSKAVARLLAKLKKVTQFMNQASGIAQFIKSEMAESLKDFDLDKDEPNNYVQAFYKEQHQSKEKWSFTDEQLLTSVHNLLVGGTDSTATTLRWAIFYLAHNPEWQEKVYEEIRKETPGNLFLNYGDRTKMPLTEATIMETQRLGNLVPLGIMRRAMVDNKLFGYDIPEDTVVVPLLTGVLWDPKIYPDPEAFDPTRFLNGHKNGEKTVEVTHLIPFSVGRRFCMGESLSRLELFLFFTALVSKFKYSFPANEPVPPLNAERVSFIRGPIRYKICATRRSD